MTPIHIPPSRQPQNKTPFFITYSVLSLRPSSALFPHPLSTSRASRPTTTAALHHDHPPIPTAKSLPRRSFLTTLALALTTPLLPTDHHNPPSVAASPARRGLAEGEAASILSQALSTLPPTWPFTPSDFTRVDSSPDTTFYTTPRLVRHIDAPAVTALRNFTRDTLLTPTSIETPMQVLDLCASIESYLPTPLPPKVEVSGLGMNATELSANPSLTNRVVKDLNVDPTLPYPTSTFDLITCNLSIDYLTNPLAILREVARTLRPNSLLAIAFSDRLFATKAVANWTAGGDPDHIYTIAAYLHYTYAFDPPFIHDISPRRFGDCTGDPLYVMVARRLQTPVQPPPPPV